MAAEGVDEQLAQLQREISNLTAKIDREEGKPKSERDPTDLAAWRKEKEQLRKKDEQLRDERLLLLQRQQHSPAARSSDLAIQRIEKKLNIMDGRQVSIEGK
jgi:predicted  nucleic acid-binding Zn-ribbon protein